ncbi:leucine-rich repeat domain-containing protein [Stratiformator vulcanicus]|uniref:Internalin-A n=1 Tax=Stratiformator vulcanicus TaxID=2527980 RepID=A0A517R0K0_9PLAN|nr:hypothetical protein [Stratiformator vulcanicus]QDT37398.1 Internalin-A precursor [Stratiformator vulcanicus]
MIRFWQSFGARSTLLLILVLFAVGCGERVERLTPPEIPRAPLAPPVTSGKTVAELREELGANENAQFTKVGGKIVEAQLFQSGVTDIAPLEGLPLRVLDIGGLPVESIAVVSGMPLVDLTLEETKVADLSPLEGMQLEIFKAQNTPVADISVLKTMPLRQLNLMGTQVADFESLSEMPLETLWLPQTKFADLSKLSGLRLASLDVQDSLVSDLAPLSDMKSLRRLNIAGTKVSDLTPLEGLPLERLIFSPTEIAKGLDTIRSMKSLREIGDSFQTRLPPEQFWMQFDESDNL